MDQANKLADKKRKNDQRDNMAGVNSTLTSKLMTERDVTTPHNGTLAAMSQLEQRHLATHLSNTEQRRYVPEVERRLLARTMHMTSRRTTAATCRTSAAADAIISRGSRESTAAQKAARQ